MRFLEHLKPLGLMLLRVAAGIVFMYHGYPKLISDSPHWVQAVSRIGLPGYFAYIFGIIELFGGGLLIIGLFTRGAALLLAIDMGIMLSKMNLSPGSIYAVERYELPLLLGAAALALATTGAGLFSFDAFTFESGGTAPKKSKASS